MNLEPNRHAALCFIPVGFTVEALASGEEPDGAPHFTEGMRQQFTVE
ncbi:MAG: hypothetical protein ACT4OX_10920 [Actinomycetota bacterium]